MKFKLDENLPADLKELLRSAGHDATDVQEESLGGEADPTVLEAAVAEGRILVTFDLDFADIRRFPPGSHAGIVVFRLRDQRWESLKRPARRLMASDTLGNLKRGLAVVDESRIRLRAGGKKRSRKE